MDNLSVGVIGLGNAGLLHCSYIDDIDGAELSAVCARHKSSFDISIPKDFDYEVSGLREVKSKISQSEISTFTDYRELIQNAQIDLVIIAAPHFLHPEMSIEAFKEDVHVICEKPISVTAAKARRMIEASEKSNSVFSVMFQYRACPQNKKIKEIIKGNNLGEIRRINWIKTNFFRTQTYYDSVDWRGTWNGEGGGILTNQAPHDLDLFQWFFGLPKKILALTYLGKWHNIPVEDDISVLMEMKNGATATFITTTGDAAGTDRLEIIGDKGKLIRKGEDVVFYDLGTSTREIIKDAERGFYRPKYDKKEINVPSEPNTHKKITQNTVDFIRGKEDDLISPGRDGIKSVQIANTMLYSGLKEKKISFPVSEDKFEEMLENLKKKESEESLS